MANPRSPGLNWVFPVAGPSEWSPGSWMPNTLTHRGRTHGAIDIYAQEGTPIVSPVSGTVTGVGNGDVGGHFVRITGDDGVVYYFAHMASASPLQKGARVNVADQVGTVGRTGSAKNTKPHLHFSMRSPGGGRALNPIPYLTDGYRLDAPPGQSYVDESGEQRNASAALDFDYATAADITRGVIGEDQVPAPVATATDILGGAFASASDLVAGGNRADYRTLGRTGVSTAQLEVTVAGEDDEEEKPSALGRLLGRGQ
jgi:hypothetical protein